MDKKYKTIYADPPLGRKGALSTYRDLIINH